MTLKIIPQIKLESVNLFVIFDIFFCIYLQFTYTVKKRHYNVPYNLLRTKKFSGPTSTLNVCTYFRTIRKKKVLIE